MAIKMNLRIAHALFALVFLGGITLGSVVNPWFYTIAVAGAAAGMSLEPKMRALSLSDRVSDSQEETA